MLETMCIGTVEAPGYYVEYPSLARIDIQPYNIKFGGQNVPEWDIT